MGKPMLLTICAFSLCFQCLQSRNTKLDKEALSEVRVKDEEGGKDWILKVRGDQIVQQYRDGDTAASAAAVGKDKKPWPGGRVPYVISKNYNGQERKIIEHGLQHLNSQMKNCVKFVPREDERDYVFITDGDGCFSAVGHTGNQQFMTLNKGGCMSQGTVIHEATHALGFDHTQCRTDRDSYLDILYNNINKKWWYAYDKMKFTNNELVPFDYYSVMIYDPFNSFAVDPKKPTMTTKNPGKTRLVSDAERPQLSKLDIDMIRKFYKCQ